jgi:hypothetical protein
MLSGHAKRSMVIQTPTVPRTPLWLRRFWVPLLLTFVGVRMWMTPDPPLSVWDWILRGTYAVVVPVLWVQALKRPNPPSVQVGLHDSN